MKIPDHGNVLYCIALELVGTILRRQSALKWIHKRGNWWWPPSDRGRGVDPNCISRQKRQCTKAKTKKTTKDKDVSRELDPNCIFTQKRRSKIIH